MTASVTAVCTVHALLRDRGSIGVTAIDKRPLETAVRVRPYGLHGDVQADRAHHGGLEQAVYAYADEDAAWFERELGRALPPGSFGENLRTSGIDVSAAVLGERWSVGRRLVLEVTSPRNPCGTFERRMRVEGWVERFTARAAPGAYFRVVRAGDVRAGDPVEVVSRPAHGVTVAGWFARHDPADAGALLDADRAGEIRLVGHIRAHVERTLAAAVR